MSTPQRPDATEPDPWLGSVGLGVDAWLSGAAQEDGPPEWAGPLPTTPFVPEPGANDPAPARRRSGAPRTEKGSGFGDDRPRSRKRSGEGATSGTDRAAGGRPRRERKPKATPEELVAAMSEVELEEYARTILLDQLTGQARSRKQLADKLTGKAVPDDLARLLLDRFEEVGLVDDEAFARMWIASRQPGKGLAGRALAQELRRKGIDDDIVKETVAEIDPDDEQVAARRLVARKLRSVARLERQVATRRLVGMLARKGYGSGLAFSVVREALDAVEAGEEYDPDDWAESGAGSWR